MRKILLLAFLIPGLAAANCNWCEDIYGGFRIGGRNMGFKSGFGDRLFAKNFVQYSVFGGLNFTDHFGAELSLFTTQDQKRKVTVNQGVTELGRTNFTGATADTFNTKTQLYGGTLQATARCPLTKCLDVYGSAGVGLGKLKLKATPTTNANNRINESITKAYPVLGAGLNWRIAKCFGARADLGWEGTQVFKSTFQTPAGSNQVKAKSSFVYGLSAYLAL